MPTLSKHVESLIERRLKGRVQDFEKKQSAKQGRIEEAE